MNSGRVRLLGKVGRALLLCSAAYSGAAHANSERANHLAEGDLVSPSAAWAHYGTGTQHTDTIPDTWRDSDEVVALARGFGSDEPAISNDQYAERVLRSLKSNIETEFRFELGKGGRMAWIDQSGTAFDQAELMDTLLEKKGISSQIRVGTITLNSQEFGAWTGLAHSVNEANQTFAVEARAACEFLASGGIPGTVNGSTNCAGLSGALNNVTLGHVWVYANGKSYDPAYKVREFYEGTDIATAAGCGTEASSTCGSQTTASAMSGATQSTLAGSPTIQNVNVSSLTSQMNSLATNVENTIKTNAPEATLVEFTGGSELHDKQDTTVAAALPYPSSVQQALTGEIPNQYRVKLRFRYQTMDRTFYLDELDVSGIEWTGPAYPPPGTGPAYSAQLRIAGVEIASAPTCGAGPTQAGPGCNYGNFNDWQLDVTHQYADTDLGDEYIRQSAKYLGGFTVVVSPGEVSQSRSFYSEQYAKQLNKEASEIPLYFVSGRSVGKVAANATTISDILARQSLASRGLSSALDARLTRHHRVISAEATFASANAMSSTGATAVTPYQFSSSERDAVFHTLNTLDAIAEDTLSNLMLRFTVPSTMKWMNQNSIRFAEVAPSGVSSIIAQLDDYETANISGLQWAGNNGFTTILPIDGEPPCKFSLTLDSATTQACPKAQDAPSFIFKSDGGAHLVGARFKGSDYFKSPESSNEEEDFSFTQAKYVDLDNGIGTFVLRPPADISTGTGEFPARLSLSRTYDSSTRQNEVFRQHVIFGADAKFQNYYNAPGVNYMQNVGQIGGGWSHNLQGIAYVGTDHSVSFGQVAALQAAPYLASMLVIRDQFDAANFSNKLSSIFVMDWLGEQIFHKAVTVEVPESGTETFIQLPSGQYAGPPNTSSRLSVSGSYVGPRPLRDLGSGQFGYVGLTITYENGAGDQLNFSESSGYFHGTDAFLTSWTSASGLRANYTWNNQPEEDFPEYLYQGEPGYLTSIGNSLGRSLTLDVAQITPSAPPPASNSAWIDQRWLLNSVTDENGRTVSYTRSDCGSAPLSFFDIPLIILCDTMEVELPDQTVLKYTYEPGTDSPDHDLVQHAPTALRRLFTSRDLVNPFQTFRFDELYRVSEVEDATGIVTRILPGSVGGEQFKEGLSIDALGNVTTQRFDANNRLTEQIDPLGRVSENQYSEAGLLLREIMPEGNATEYTYDVRGNRLTTCQIAKGRVTWTALSNPDAPQCDAALGDLVAQVFYIGGTTLQPDQCTNQRTCNKPSHMIDPRGFRTNYTWSSVHGGILSEQSGLNSSGACTLAGGVCPETTYQYSAFTGTDGANFYLPTAMTEKIDATSSVTTRYEYDAANKFVLKARIVDDGATELRTCFGYDAVGNMISQTEPKGTGGICP